LDIENNGRFGFAIPKNIEICGPNYSKNSFKFYIPPRFFSLKPGLLKVVASTPEGSLTIVGSPVLLLANIKSYNEVINNKKIIIMRPTCNKK